MSKRPAANQDPVEFPLPPSTVRRHDESTPTIEPAEPQALEQCKPVESVANHSDKPNCIETVRPSIIPNAPRREVANMFTPFDVEKICYVYYFDRSEPRFPIAAHQATLDQLRRDRSSRLCSETLPSDISRYIIGPMLDHLSPGVLSSSKAYYMEMDRTRIVGPDLRTSLILPSGLIAVVYTLEYLSVLFSICIFHPSGALLTEILVYADMERARQTYGWTYCGLAESKRRSIVSKMKCVVMPDGRLGIYYESVIGFEDRPRAPARSFAFDVDVYSTKPKVCAELNIYDTLAAHQEKRNPHLEFDYGGVPPYGPDDFKISYVVEHQGQPTPIFPPDDLFFLEERWDVLDSKMCVFDRPSKKAFFLAYDKTHNLFIVPYCTEQWTALEPIYLFNERESPTGNHPQTTLSLMLGPRGELYAYETSPEDTAMRCAMIRICTVLSAKPWNIEDFDSRFIPMVQPQVK